MKLNIKRIKRNQSGISHIVVPLTVVLVVAIGGTFLLVSSHATQQTKRKKFKTYHYSNVDKAQFALAAADYWGQPLPVDSKKNNPKSFSISQADCKPGDVTLRYVKDYKDERVARVLPYSAFRMSDGQKNAKKWNSKYYCVMTFNLAQQKSIPKKVQACVVFIHEYGHMLGHDHNLFIGSPMYNGYVPGEGGPEGSYNTSQYAAMQQSICSKFHVGHFGNT